MAFRYYNRNPEGYKIPDCVIRAISTAMDLDYYNVMALLHLNGEYYKCDDLCVCCYEKLLDYDFELPHYSGFGKTAKQIAKEFNDEIVILRMEGHLSCSLYGVIYDIWNCENEIITDFWIVPK